MIQLQDVVEIEATPEQIFDWLLHLPENYLAWHPDHVACRYLRGSRMGTGSEIYVEEYLHGELHKLKLRMTKVIPGRRMEYAIMPGMKGAFDVAPHNGQTRFIATITMGTTWPVLGAMLDWGLRVFLGHRIKALAEHMAEEGENLRLLFGTAISARNSIASSVQGGNSTMRRLINLLPISIGAALSVVLGWRFLSRRYLLPCPSWLAWLLENRYVDAVAHANRILAHMKLEPGLAILDVGCGPGRLTIPLAVAVGEKGQVVGLDIQPAMLRQARQRAATAGLTNIQFVHGEASRHNFDSGTFDRAVLVTVLGEIPHRQAALAAIFDALKPGGLLTITELLPDPHYQPVGHVRQLAAAVGFAEVDYAGSGLAYTINFVKPGATVTPVATTARTRAAPNPLSLTWDLWSARYLTPAALEARQHTRLQQMIAYARTHSAFYRAHYANCPSIITAPDQLPPVTKAKLMANFDAWATDPLVTKQRVQGFVADETHSGYLLYNRYAVWRTSGTTGEPGIFLHDEYALALYSALLMTRGWPVWAPPRAYPHLLRHGFREALVVATGSHFAAAANLEQVRLRYPWLADRVHTFSVLLPMPELVAQLNVYQPTMLFGYPGVLHLLAQEQDAGRLKISPCVIGGGGESLFPDVRTQAEAAFGCPVYDLYGSSEFIYIALECPHGRLHINADWVLLEPVDQEYHPVAPGQRSHTVLLTNLANRVQPILRYDLGDSVTILPEPCPCGSPLPAMYVEGRHDDILALARADGELVHLLPMALSALMEGVPGVQRFQLIQAGPATLRVRLDVTGGANKDVVWAATHRRLLTYLTAQGLPDIQIERASEPPCQNPISDKFRHVWVEWSV